MLATGSDVVQLWALSSTHSFCKLDFPSSVINDVRYSADSRSLHIGGNTEHLTTVNLYTGERRTLGTDSPTITKISCSRNGQYTATGSRSGSVAVFSQGSESPEIFRSHRNEITSLVFTNDSSALIAGDKSGRISIGSFKRSRLPGWSSKNGSVYEISGARHSNSIAIACDIGLLFYDIDSSKTSGIDAVKARRVCHSPFKDNFVVVGTADAELVFYDPSARTIVSTVALSGEINAIDFKFDGVTVAAAINGSGVKLFDIRKLDRAVGLKIDPANVVRTLAFQQQPLEDAIFAEFIQYVAEPEPIPVPEIDPPATAEAVPEEPEIDLDEVRRTIQAIAEDVQLHEPTLSPRNAAFLKSARELQKPLAVGVPSVLFPSEPKRDEKDKEPDDSEKFSETREIGRIISAVWREAIDGVLQETSDALNVAHLDVLTKLAQVQRELEGILS
jgi:hypothetical protein